MIEIIVRGIPAPQGSKRHVGRGIMIESSARVRPWRDRIAGETQSLVPVPLAGPVSVRIWFLLPRPGSHYRTGKTTSHLLASSAPLYPAGKKDDLDKLVRATLDGLTDGGAWNDDGQVVDLITRKRYAGGGVSPGCKIEISEVAG